MTSTSKIKLLLGGMTAPKPASPYARLDGMYNVDFSPTHIPVDKRKVQKKNKKEREKNFRLQRSAPRSKKKKKNTKKRKLYVPGIDCSHPLITWLSPTVNSKG